MSKKRNRRISLIEEVDAKRKRSHWSFPVIIGIVLVAGILFDHWRQTYQRSRVVDFSQSIGRERVYLPNFGEICEADAADLRKQDIALLNLRSAEGLPGAERLDVAACLETIDRWAERVRNETHRNLGRFYLAPHEYRESLSYFRILMLVTVLQQDFGVHYDSDLIHNVNFTNSENLFIHGMLDGRGGTCVSIPVLYTAIARRLGYPVYLVNAKAHVFCRWDGGGERFNIEATNQGLNVYDDEHYLEWPHPIAKQEVERGEYLKSLSMGESFATFLAARGHCYEDNGDLSKAREAYRLAIEKAPHQPMYRHFLSKISRATRLEDYPHVYRQQMALKRRAHQQMVGGVRASKADSQTPSTRLQF